MSLECKQIKQFLEQWPNIPDSSKEEVTVHLDQCEQCRSLHGTDLDLLHLLDQARSTYTEVTYQGPPPVMQPTGMPVLRWAAACAVLLALGSVVLFVGHIADSRNHVAFTKRPSLGHLATVPSLPAGWSSPQVSLNMHGMASAIARIDSDLGTHVPSLPSAPQRESLLRQHSRVLYNVQLARIDHTVPATAANHLARIGQSLDPPICSVSTRLHRRIFVSTHPGGCITPSRRKSVIDAG